MKLKQGVFILFLILVLAGCGNEQPASQSPSSGDKGVELENVETIEVSEGTEVDSSSEKIDTSVQEQEAETIQEDHSDCKAVGYDYDYDNLTYELVWSDEFDYEGIPDESKWGYDVGGSGWGNNELQYYTAGENVYVEDGICTITARKEDYSGKEYTSTRMISKNKGDWLYGRIEIRAKLPMGVGTWPAIWMLPTDWKYGGWPRSGEIDIMEHVGYDMGQIHGTIHTDAYNHVKGTQLGKSVTREDASEAFHTYTMEWLPDKIMIYADEKLYFVYKPSNLIECPGVDEWPFDQRFHLLMNIAVGGNWGGAKGVDPDIYPQTMEIDYVRVYQATEFSDLQPGM